MLSFLVIGLVLLVGLLSTRLMKLVKLPNVTGYLITGILLGPCVLGLAFKGVDFMGQPLFDQIYDKNVMTFISNAALGFIAFSIGTSFKLTSLKKVGKRVLIITVFEALGGAIFVLIGLFITKIFIRDIPIEIILTLGAIACATAPAATLMVVKQYKAKGPVTNTLLPVVAFDDAVALIAFEILFSIAKAMAKGTTPDFMSIAVWPLVSIIGSLLIGTGLGFLVSLGCKLFKSRANRMIMCIVAIFLCTAISLIPFSSFLPSNINISVSSLLMTMMVGAVLINTRADSELIFERMDMFTPPIFMLFFIVSGANLDLTIFASKNAFVMIVIAIVYLLTRALGKWVGAFSSAKISKAEPTVQKYLGFTLFPQAGVAIGLASTASQTLVADGNALLASDATNVLGNTLVTYGNMILAIILTSTMIYELCGPFITKIALQKAGEISK